MATILLIRFKTFGKLRPSVESIGKFITLDRSSSGVLSGVFVLKFFSSVGDDVAALELPDPIKKNKSIKIQI